MFKSYYRRGTAWITLFIFLLLAACVSQATPEARQPTTIEATQESVQSPISSQTTITEEGLENLLREVLMGDLKDVIFDYKGVSGMLFICWDLKEAYSKELITEGAQEDTVIILRSVVESGTEYDQVHISAWYPMTVDINNTIEDTEVISLYYDKPTLEGRNWDTIRKQYIWWIADRGFVNKELQR